MTHPTYPYSSINEAEVQQFNKISSQWWDEEGPFKPLHQLNPTRIRYIRDGLIAHFKRDPKAPQPLEGLTILDIGCGGGLVTEPLTRLGATVMGIDASHKAIEVAKAHAELMGLSIQYQCIAAEDLKDSFDAVLALEIVEHVDHVDSFIKTCSDLVSPQGILILSTLNRTWKAYGIAILGAEYLLKWLPIGTHDWHKFLSPAELAAFLRPQGFVFETLQGMSFNPLTGQWSLTSDLSVNYLGCATRANYS